MHLEWADTFYCTEIQTYTREILKFVTRIDNNIKKKSQILYIGDNNILLHQH